ncbi:probable LRR receptor-like serine/threonine-protein kinase RKF3 [Salvia miltiorrhiza]|uniref:probable LRR receptor-like serine/threonine-protein kinase RKF3 n=1 Tax=Salvia miltiorrhiza TaxID=226208 RepID=UPI0025AD12A4|nr:probable LRR receptor-like serine/threonine-protein kinase RKF3 [Salvia miltiorrhiza]
MGPTFARPSPRPRRPPPPHQLVLAPARLRRVVLGNLRDVVDRPRVHEHHHEGPLVGNVSDCTAYPFIYAVTFANQFGPTDVGTTKCLFNLDFTSSHSNSKRKKIVIYVVVVACVVILILGFAVFWFLRRRKERLLKQKWKSMRTDTNMSSGLDSISASTTLIRFTFDEIKAATRNFARDHIIGRGGYGNVYKGVLPDDSEVALKRWAPQLE